MPLVEDELVAKRPLIESIARSFIRRTASIEYDDAVQVVSIVAWRVLSRPDEAWANVDAQIVTVGLRRLIDEVRTGTTGGLTRTQLKDGTRRPLRLNKQVATADGPVEFLELLPDPDDHYAKVNDDQTPSLQAALAALPERDRFVIYLHYYENLTEREIAELLGVSDSRVSQLLSRARERIRPRLVA